MGQRYVLCPNGKYAIFSSIVDNFTSYNLTLEQLLDAVAEEAAKDARGMVIDILKRNESENKDHSLYEDTLSKIEDIYGAQEVTACRARMEPRKRRKKE